MRCGTGADDRQGDLDASYLARFVHDLPDAALAVGPDGTIVAANDLVQQVLGYVPDMLVGASVEVLVPDPAREQHASWRARFARTPNPRPMGGGMILAARRADGTELPAEVSLSPLGGGVTVAILRDRSETVAARRRLQHRLDVERLGVSISSSLAGASGGELERQLNAALGQVCGLLGADHALLYAPTADGAHLELVNEWCAPEVDPDRGRVERLPRAPFGWSGARLQRGEAVLIAEVGDLPPEAAAEAAFMTEHGIRSALTIPLGSSAEYEGTLTVRWTRTTCTWEADERELVRLLGNVFLAGHRRRQAEAIRDASEERHRLLVDTLAAGIVLIRQHDARIVSANPAAAQILGVAVDDLVGADALSADLGLLGADGTLLASEDRHRLLETLFGGSTQGFGYRRTDGDVVWLEVRGVEVVLGDEQHLAVSFIDVTERRAAEELLVTRALHDPLTGLANRLLFAEQTRSTLARSSRNGTGAALIFLDLDHFKRVNDRYGHAVGDELLAAVARRLRTELRATDVVARLGGDEFVAVLGDVTEPSMTEALAERVRRALAAPIVVGDVTHELSASIGLAGASADEAGTITVDELLRRADQAMYAAKESGRARWATWSDALVSATRHREQLEAELHRSLLDDSFVLRYQPVYDLDAGRLVGAEALVRWRHPQRGLLGPEDFLDVAEDSGLIVPLGQLVLEQACATATTWPADLWVSVNLSARQIGANGAARRVRQVLEGTGLSADRLHLELTESALIEGSHSALEDIAAIRDLGAVIGLDDFGTGYSSMTYLHTLPLSFLKIDRSFVGELDDRSGHRAATIVDMVLRLAERFGLCVIAEGVETEAQASHLRGLGCRFVQGFLYGAPVPAQDLERAFGAPVGEGSPGPGSSAPGALSSSGQEGADGSTSLGDPSQASSASSTADPL